MEETVQTAVAQHDAVGDSQGPRGDRAAAGAENHQKVLRLEGAADVNAELAEIGLSSKSGWYASILLYGVGGIVTVLLGLLRPELVPTGVTILGGFAIVLAVLSGVGARYLSNADWATHMRLFFGLVIFLTGAVVAGDLRLAFVMLPLFVLITPTFLYGARFAIPYVSIIIPAIFIVMILTPGPGRTAHAIISSGAMLMVVLSFMAAEHRTRALARANRSLAYSDPLTGIANTRRLRETLSFHLGRSREEGPFALFAIDLDNFKLVNDTFDHTTGDKVLKAVADALAGEVGADDLVARRGGDEFSVLIAHPDGVDMARLTTRLSKAIERARMATCPQVTPSGSVAYVTSADGDTISSILQRADDELHETKLAFHAEHGDRDSVVVSLGGELDPSAPRVADREAAMRSVSAAVSRAYDGPRRRGATNLSRMVEDTKNFIRSLDPIWGFVMSMTAPIGIVFLILTLVGAFDPMPLAVGVIASGILLALTVWCWHSSRNHVSSRHVLWVFLGSIGAVTLMLAYAGQTGTAILDVFLVLGMFGFYFLRSKAAVMVLALCAALFVGFAVGADYPDGGIRSAVTLAVMFVAAAIVMKVRSLTLGFVRTNRELSEIDALTGVANLRALRLRVQSAIGEAEGADTPAPILLTVDLDRFKLVNDKYNHTTGDQVLTAVARAVSETVRMDEMVARRGGDEFFVLFQKTSPEHIENVIPRIEQAVKHARERICPDLVPTASVGYVMWRSGQTADDFMESADGVMHDEKIDTRARGYAESAA